MKTDRLSKLERFESLFEVPEQSFEAFLRRRDRKRRNQRITAGVVAIAVFLIPVWLITTDHESQRSNTPAVSTPTVPPFSPSPPRARWTRTVEGVEFSFRADRSWTAGPITESADGVLRFGHLLISKSIEGPQGAEAVIFWTSMSDGPATPCGQWWGSPVGSIGDFAAAVATARGTELVEEPSRVTVGGLPAQHVVVTVRQDIGCDPGFFYRWHAECRGPCWMESTVGDTIRVWFVDVDGTRLFFEAQTSTEADADLEREIERIVGSIRFG